MMEQGMPAQLRSLVHHVRLNQTGWWEEAVCQIIVAALYELGGQGGPNEIAEVLRASFGIELGGDALLARLADLEAAGKVVERADSRLLLRQAEIDRFEERLDQLRQTEHGCRLHFARVYEQVAGEPAGEEEWERFAGQLLIPVVKHYGAEMYDLITGAGLPGNQPLPDEVLDSYPEELQEKMRKVASGFLDPSQPSVRRYVLALLDSFFAVEACGLTQATLDALNAAVGSRPRFTLFLDTNFVVSVFGLNEEYMNEAASKLLSLIGAVRQSAEVELRIVPETYKETRNLFGKKASQLRGVAISRDIAAATGMTNVSSIVRSYFVAAGRGGERLSAADFFAPYTDGLVASLKSHGIEMHQDAALAQYATMQAVIDDVTEQVDRDAHRDPANRKDWDSWQHDLILWHYTLDRRPQIAESPVDARYWVLTQDYRLMGFDRHKYGELGSVLPVCVDPTRFAQLLSFWLPRSDLVEEAILTSLRVPFAMQTFDASSEDAAIAIARAFSSYSSLPDEVVAAVESNHALKERLLGERDDSHRQQVASEAVNSEYRLYVEKIEERLAAAAQAATEAEERIEAIAERDREREQALRETEKQLAAAEEAQQRQRDEARHLRAQAADAEATRKAAAAEMKRQEEQLTALEDRLAQAEAVRIQDHVNRVRASFVWLWLVLPALLGLALLPVIPSLLAVTGGTGAWELKWGGLSAALWLIAAAWLARTRGCRMEELSSWTVFSTFCGAVNWVMAALGMVAAGVVASILFEAYR